MADAAAKHKKERAVCRTQVTKKCKLYKELMVQRNYERALTTINQAEQAYTRMLELSELYRNAVELEDKDFEKDLEDDFNYTDAICEIKTNYNQHKSAEPKPQAPPDVPVPHKLDPLPVPVFKGDRSEFSNFWTLFKQRIDKDSRLQDMDKHAYLLSKVEGAAKDAIVQIPVTATGYTRAKNILLNRFGKKMTLVHDCMSRILTTPVPQECTANGVRSLSDTLNLHVRTLEALGVNATVCSPVLSPLLLGKIPAGLKGRFYEQNDGGVNATIDDDGYDPPSVDSILTFLAAQAENAELSEPYDTYTSELPQKSAGRHNRSNGYKARRKAAITAMGVQTERQNNTSTFECQMCSSTEHSLRKCQRYLELTTDERNKTVQKNGLCFNCLSSTHRVQQCQSLTNCLRCSGRHHTSLCRMRNTTNAPKGKRTSPQNSAAFKNETNLQDEREIKPPSTAAVKLQSSSITTTTNMHTSEGTYGFFPTVRANLLVKKGGTTKRYPVRLLLDSCSSSTFIETEIASKHQLSPVANVPLTMTFFAKGSIKRVVPQYELTLESFDGTQHLNISAYGMDVCLPLKPTSINTKNFPHLSKLKFSDPPSQEGGREVDILVGFDYYHDIVRSKISKGSKQAPVAIDTIFGWALHGGGQQHPPVDGNFSVSTLHMQTSNSVEPTLQDCVSKMTDWAFFAPQHKEEENRWIEPQLIDGRYQVRLPWINQDRPAPNRSQVLPLQASLYKKLSAAKREEYAEYFGNYERLDIVEECGQGVSRNAWYLPYHGIWQNNKLRVVFNGSFGKPSLNERLYTGPNLLQLVPVCLTSFRLYAIPVTADVEKAFLQIGVHPDDRDYLRFLAFSDNREKDFRFCRVPFGLNASPAILNTCLQHLYKTAEDEYSCTTDQLRRSVYCDDLVTSVSSQEELAKLREESCTVFKSASMNLRGWTSEPNKVLGICYRPEEDNFVIQLQMKELPKEGDNLTRRHIASEAAKVFDPMGWTAPWSVRIKWLIQESWEPKVDWDTPLSTQLSAQWEKLCQQAYRRDVQVPRHIGFGNSGNLHIFCDASARAYAACAYLTSDKEAHLLLSRNRVVPLNSKTTIPRLELQAAVLGVHLLEEVLSAFDKQCVIQIHMWVDSTCVLQWLSGPVAKQPTYVANRVSRIQEVSGEHKVQWHHCGSKENPADLATRGLTPQVLQESTLWFQGPAWLINRSDWPKEIQPILHSISAQPQEAQPVLNIASAKSKGSEEAEEAFVESYLKNFSSLKTAIGCTSIIKRVLSNDSFAKSMFLSVPKMKVTEPPLTFMEREQARLTLVRLVQREGLAHLREILVTNPAKMPREFKRIRPFLDTQTDLIMATPRTGEHPLILLPRYSHFVNLLIQDTHNTLYHAGTPRVMTEIQQTYWVLKLRSTCMKVLRACTRCERYQSRPYQSSEGAMAPFRSQYAPPFAHTGLDYAEAIQLTPGKRVYLLLFTCAVSRAVHIEICTDMKSDTLFSALTRFMGRRGPPSNYYSDNAKSFIKLSTMVDARWTFIPARSPWWGGWWERMVGTVKSALRKTLHLSALTLDELATVLADLEGVINRRPITYVSDNPDSISPLTPAHFLHVPILVGEPWGALTDTELTARWRHWRSRAEALLGRWRNHYLSELRSWRSPPNSGNTRVPTEGDIVLIKEGPKRSLWPLGKITKVLSEHLAQVKVRGHDTLRPVKLLYPLESRPPWSPLPYLLAPVHEEAPVPPVHVEEVPEQDEQIPATRVTRRGRIVKRPARFLD